MPRPRCFKNKLPDYTAGADVHILADKWHSEVVSVIHAINDTIPFTVTSDGGMYVGSTGIAYMLCHVSMYEPLAKHRDTYLQLAYSIYEKDVKFASKTRSAAEAVSFILGPAGVYALGAILGKLMRNNNLVQQSVNTYRSLASICLKPNFLACGCDELFVGRAGYLCGALAIQRVLGSQVLEDATISSICSMIVQSGKEYSKRHNSPAPLMYAYYDTEYLGAAHGISSILQMLLSCPSFLASKPEEVRLVKATVDWLLTLQQPNGNFVPAMDEVVKGRPEEDELVHWCHGAPGLVYLFAKAYVVWKSPEYLDACVKCGEITWHKGLLTKGPGICHGIAGSGYVFLLLYQLTKDKKHLHRANQFAQFMFTQEFRSGARTPDSPYSLYEGWAGTVCFLVDLLQPEKAAYPFFNIF